ncbi:uncharacterized membrane protein YozB (DUF420 family) [Paenibacillus sediminis]|uniref:Uncharacterized membrane protein YozB (DUF420 family) n=1 Tax=Paenibacillus sediminis TaxID=664909 RepID=A0ABS4H860_9BACL|nr:uncharacterized membrane protein YozB (DUF420 family) [Paenibacillus sediminis]
MMRNYITLIISIFLIFLVFFELRTLQQPKTGPVGDGTISPLLYISIISSLLLGIIWFPLSIYRIYKGKKQADSNSKKKSD